MKKIFMLLASAALLFGCGEDKVTEEGNSYPKGELSLTASALMFDAAGTSTTNVITVTTNGEWRLVGDKQWCTPSAMKGKSGDKITFTALENDTDEIRTEIFTIICADKAIKINVEQYPVGVIEITKDAFEVVAGNSTVSIRLSHNLDYKVEIAEGAKSWLSYTDPTKSKATQIGFCQFTIAANDTFVDRTGTATITTATGESKTITVTQVKNIGFEIPAKVDFELPMTGGTVVFNFKTNDDYTVSIPTRAKTWLSIDEGSTEPVTGLTPVTRTFTVAAATGTRGTTVTFTSKKDSSKKMYLTFAQKSTTPIFATITDTKLAAWLVKDGYLLPSTEAPKYEMTEDATNAKELILPAGDVVSMEGIEAFTNLETLNASNNSIVTLDVSKCAKLKNITIAGNIANLKFGDAVETFLMSYNLWGSPQIVVSGNNLKNFNIPDTYSLKKLDLSACPNLTNVDFSGYTKLDILYLKTGQATPTVKGNQPKKIEYL